MGEKTWPLDLGRVFIQAGRTLYGFGLELSPRALEKVGVLHRLLGVFSEMGVNLVHFILSKPTPGDPVRMVFYADMTGREGDVEELAERLRRSEDVEEVRVVRPVAPGVLVDTLFFPPTDLGERVYILRETAYREFFRVTHEKFGAGGQAYLYHLGFGIGRRVFQDHLRSSPLFSRRDAVKIARAFFQVMGYGRVVELDIDEARREARVVVERLLECEALGKRGRPSSHYVRGILAGWFTGYFGTPMTALETRCISAGSPVCEFRITPLQKRP